MRFDLDYNREAFDDLEQRLLGMGVRSADMRPAMRDVLDEMRASERRLFASGRGWRPLETSTRKRKAREGLPRKTMVASGLLYRTLTAASELPGAERDVDRDGVTFGIERGKTPVYYARFHQRGQGNPTRRVVQIDRRARTRINQVLRRYVLTGG